MSRFNVMPRVNLWFDREPGLPQITILGITICWRSRAGSGLEIVLLRRWRILHMGFNK